MTHVKRSASTDADLCALHKEWDEASCPICMDHPHNAVLILCSSHDKGCRSYICDTSYRHSNCLDRFKKLKVESGSNAAQPSSSFIVESLDNGRTYSFDESNTRNQRLAVTQEDSNSQGTGRHLETHRIGNDYDLHRERTSSEEFGDVSLIDSTLHLKCPLCRGSVIGFEIVKEARQYLDLKQRSCSRESCSFIGNYKELRRHARRVHPTTRPADVDPTRERTWHHLEHQREYGDIVSAIRSAMPGAIMLGDYAIDDVDHSTGVGEAGLGEGSGPWWTTFFLFHMIDPLATIDEPRRSSRAWRRHRRSSGAFSGRRNLWGENLLGLQDDDENWIMGSDDMGDDVPVPRRRRRLSRSRSEDRP